MWGRERRTNICYLALFRLKEKPFSSFIGDFGEVVMARFCRFWSFWATALVACLTFAQTGLAQDAPTPNEENVVKGHGFQLGMSFVGVPDALLDLGFEEHGSFWDDAVNMGVSLDYFLRFARPCEMRFSLSWINAKTGDGYWLAKENADRPELADYLVNRHHIVSLEVAAYHVVSIIDEIAFYYGGGGWFGVVLGDAQKYAVRTTCAREGLSTCPHELASAPLDEIPDVFGFVIVTLGFKFTLWDRMTIRAEGGYKGYFYGQIGLGVEF